MTTAKIAATVVEMDDGRLAMLVEMDPAPELGPWVLDATRNHTPVADPDGPEER